jgi:hypothetical protein
MTSILMKNRDGSLITCMCNWQRPKDPYVHWKDGRSAKELARAWMCPDCHCPDEIAQLLESNALTGSVRIVEGYPEHFTYLPKRGGPRNHDLYLKAISQQGDPVTICVEAKADETFDDMIGDHARRALEKSSKSGVPERIAALSAIVFGKDTKVKEEERDQLYYQLLTGVAAAAIQAALDGADLAVFVVHEFVCPGTKSKTVAKNADDFRDFVRAFISAPSDDVVSGRLYGPVSLTVDALNREKGLRKSDIVSSTVNMFIGKAVRNLGEHISIADD